MFVIGLPEDLAPWSIIMAFQESDHYITAPENYIIN
jgi:hypothetical protein